jgi:hypothetical protein
VHSRKRLLGHGFRPRKHELPHHEREYTTDHLGRRVRERDCGGWRGV